MIRGGRPSDMIVNPKNDNAHCTVIFTRSANMLGVRQIMLMKLLERKGLMNELL